MIDKNLVTTAAVFVLEDTNTIFPSVISQNINFLSKSELQRLTRMKNPMRRQKYEIARFLLFEAIRQQLGVKVMISSSPSGQPSILGHPIFCSISYSGHSTSIGFSTHGAMGIDIEKHRQRKIDRLVRYYFHADEINYFDTLNESQKMPWFYRQWTVKEATAKTGGEGLSTRNLSSKIDEIGTETISVYTNHNYSLACVHHSNQTAQLADVAILDSPPWLNFSLIDWSSHRNI